jgi:6-phospho-3-hexuloisomerase
MMNTTEYSIEIIKELEQILSRLEPQNSEKLCNLILSAKRIFVAGAGRSGFMIRAFAMRLMHMGFTAYVVGETVTPNIEADDLLIIGSGSGETASLVSMAVKAKSIGFTLALVSIFPESTIGDQAEAIIKIPAPTPKVKIDTGVKSIQPMGSLFEQSLLLVFDSIILRLMEKQGNCSDVMFNRHANLE